MTDLVRHSFLADPVTPEVWERLELDKEVATYLVKSANRLDLQKVAGQVFRRPRRIGRPEPAPGSPASPSEETP